VVEANWQFSHFNGYLAIILIMIGYAYASYFSKVRIRHVQD
jgi:hypothetical protein